MLSSHLHLLVNDVPIGDFNTVYNAIDIYSIINTRDIYTHVTFHQLSSIGDLATLTLETMGQTVAVSGINVSATVAIPRGCTTIPLQLRVLRHDPLTANEQLLFDSVDDKLKAALVLSFPSFNVWYFPTSVCLHYTLTNVPTCPRQD